MTEPNYGWLLLTLISRLEIRKKRVVDRKQSTFLSSEPRVVAEERAQK